MPIRYEQLDSVTVANIDTLTSGGNADTLHSHGFGDGYSVVEPFIVSGENITDGYVVAIDDSSGAKLFLADANGAGELINPIGLADGTTTTGEQVNVVTSGGKDTADDVWEAIPALTDIGKIAYMSETPGLLTLTAPSTPGSIVQKIGIVANGGSGNVRLLVQIGDGVLL